MATTINQDEDFRNEQQIKDSMLKLVQNCTIQELEYLEHKLNTFLQHYTVDDNYNVVRL